MSPGRRPAPPPESKTGQLDPQRLQHPTNRRAYAYWDHIRGERLMPSRADIDPAEIPEILSCVFLLDVAEGPLDFRYRLIGTKMSASMNRDHTGRWMSEIEHQRPPSRIWSACAWVVETRMPLSSDTPYVGRHHEFKTTEDLIMPLSADGESVNMLFVTADFLP